MLLALASAAAGAASGGFDTAGRALRIFRGTFVGTSNATEFYSNAAALAAEGITTQYWMRMMGPVELDMCTVAFSTPNTPEMVFSGGQWLHYYGTSQLIVGDNAIAASPVDASFLVPGTWQLHTHTLLPNASYTWWVNDSVKLSVTLQDQPDHLFLYSGAARVLSLTMGASTTSYPQRGITSLADVELDSVRFFHGPLTAAERALSGATSAARELPPALLSRMVAAWDFDGDGGTPSTTAPFEALTYPASVGRSVLAAGDRASGDATSETAPLVAPEVRCRQYPQYVVSAAPGAALNATHFIRLRGAGNVTSLPLPSFGGTLPALAVVDASSSSLLSRCSLTASSPPSVAVAAPGAAPGEWVVVAGGGVAVRVVVRPPGSAPTAADTVAAVTAAPRDATQPVSNVVEVTAGDVDGDGLRVEILTPLPAGVAVAPLDGSTLMRNIPPQLLMPRFRVILDPGVYGAAVLTATFRVVDDTGAASPSRTLTVRAAHVNSLSRAAPMVVQLAEDGTAEFDFAAAATDPDALDLPVVVVTEFPFASARLLRSAVLPAARKWAPDDFATWRATAPAPAWTQPAALAAAAARWVEATTLLPYADQTAQRVVDVPDASYTSDVWAGPGTPIPDYSKEEVIGEPNCIGEFTPEKCWYARSADDCSQQVVDPAGRGGDYVHVRFATPVAPVSLIPDVDSVLGAVVGLWAWEGRATAANASTGRWRRLWHIDWAPPSDVRGSVPFLPLPQCGLPFLATDFLIEQDNCGPSGWSGIDAATVVGMPAPPLATAVAAGTRWRFVPKADWYGNATLTYYATDCLYDISSASASASVTFVVAPVPDPPTSAVVAPPPIAFEARAVTVAVTAADVDDPATATPGPATSARGFRVEVAGPAGVPVAWDSVNGSVIVGPVPAALCAPNVAMTIAVTVRSAPDWLAAPPVSFAITDCVPIASAALQREVATLLSAIIVPVVAVLLIAAAVAALLWWRRHQAGRPVETRPPPVGDVAMVFTDVQDSTALWELFGDAFAESLAVHDNVMREEIKRCNGYEVKTEGDAFFVAFDCVHDAVEWCIGVQHALLAAPWSGELLAELTARGLVQSDIWRSLRVRMGINVGAPLCEVSPTTHRMDYYGNPVNLAARVQGAGFGGQVLASAAARAAFEAPACARRGPRCDAGLGSGTEVLWYVHGEQKLKGIADPVPVFGVLAGVVAERIFPPLASRTGIAVSAADKLGRAKPKKGGGRHVERAVAPTVPGAAVGRSSGSLSVTPAAPNAAIPGDSLRDMASDVLRHRGASMVPTQHPPQPPTPSGLAVPLTLPGGRESPASSYAALPTHASPIVGVGITPDGQPISGFAALVLRGLADQADAQRITAGDVLARGYVREAEPGVFVDAVGRTVRPRVQSLLDDFVRFCSAYAPGEAHLALERFISGGYVHSARNVPASVTISHISDC